MAIKLGVSLYSLQEDYYLGKLDLEGCIERVSNEVGADGIEFLPDQMPLPGWPELSKEAVDLWFSWMEKYNTVPTSYGAVFFDTMYKNRMLTVKEVVDLTIEDLKRAAKLGFKVYRTGIIRKEHLEILERCLPVAEELGIQIATEIHAPRGIHTWWTQEWLEVIQRTGTKAGGFVPDMGIFSVSLPVPFVKRLLREGANEAIIARIEEAYRAKEPLSEEDVRGMGGNEKDLQALSSINRLVYDDPEWLREVLPYTKHIHGKFYEMTEDYQESSIDYANAIRVLLDAGWDGYISSEYEGQRHYFDIGCDTYMDPVEQCRRHHVMIKNLIAKLSGR